jgi:Protein of unknown function (DUF3551)
MRETVAVGIYSVGPQEAAMRLLLFILGIGVGIVGIGNRAEAQNYPWCAILNMGAQAVNCGFISSTECMTYVSGIGGFCMPNNTYQVPLFPRPMTRRARTSPR